MRKSNPSDEFDLPTSYARAGRRQSRGLFARLARLRSRVSARTALILAVAALCVGGLANALFLQDAPHPAPIFGGAPRTAAGLPKVGPAQPPPRPPVSELAATVQPAPQRPAAPAPSPSAVVPRPAVAAPTPPLPIPPQRAANDDIGRLLRGDAPAPAAAPQSDTAQIVAVQKALAMRGFEIGKADGVMGPATRQAIEAFEKRGRLPVTGQVSPRLMRALGVQTAQR